MHMKTKRSIGIHESFGDRVFLTISYALCGLVLLAVAYPLYFVLIASISDPDAVNRGETLLLPAMTSLDAYIKVFKESQVWVGYRNTILYTALSVIFSLCIVLPAAYALSRKDFPGRGPLVIFFLSAMYFNGGMVPTYLLVDSLNLTNTIWAMILPSCVNVFHLIIAKTYFETSIPIELHEAAELDGCTDFRYFIRVVLPLSKAIISVVGVYVAVASWNSYMNALMYITEESLQPLQIVLRNILLVAQVYSGQSVSMARESEMMKYALIVITTIPIICVYPFVQKYFEKGVMIGSVKG